MGVESDDRSRVDQYSRFMRVSRGLKLGCRFSVEPDSDEVSSCRSPKEFPLTSLKSSLYQQMMLRYATFRLFIGLLVNQEILRDIDSTFVACRHGRHGHDI